MEAATGVKAAEMRSKAVRLSGPAQANAFQVAQDNEDAAAAAVLNTADVVASTCVGSGEKRLEGQAFDIFVVDEASQVTEPASLVAILQVLPNQITLVWGHTSVKKRVVNKTLYRMLYSDEWNGRHVATGSDERLCYGQDRRSEWIVQRHHRARLGDV